MTKRIVVIPDVQAAPGRPMDHLVWASHYIADKRPDVVIQVGDLGDFPSLSSYDRGKAAAENRRLGKDWDAFRRAVDLLTGAWGTKGTYRPRLVYVEGNHEERIRRYANDNPAIDVLPDPVREMAQRGWESYPFLRPARVEGCLVAHFFPKTLTGRISSTSLKYGAPNANVMIRANMSSCIAGHKPGYSFDTYPGPDGRILHGLIAGSFYLHKEEYEGPQGSHYWRGLFMLNQVNKGEFDPCPVRMRYLKERYGHGKA